MIEAVLLAVLLAIIVLNIVAGPRGYRLLAEAGGAGRKTFYRRMLAAQIIQFTLPPVMGLAILDRFAAISVMPRELWQTSALLRGDGPAVMIDPLLTGIWLAAIVAAIPLGAGLTWWRVRRGKSAPRQVAYLSALLPRDRSELLVGAAISVAAGIGEELFFRLLLPMLIATFLNDVAAVAIAILLFGMAHAYQGWKGMVVTTLVGALLVIIYLMSGSLALAMLFHIAIDLMTLVIQPAIRGAWRERAA